MQRLADALEDPSRPSYPKRLRRLRQEDVQERIDKPIKIPELQNWFENGLTYGSMILEKYYIHCQNDNSPCSVTDFFLRLVDFVLKKGDSTNVVGSNIGANENHDDVSVTIADIIDYSINMKWFTGCADIDASETNTTL